MESKEQQPPPTIHVSEPAATETRLDDIITVAETKARVDAVWQQMNKGVSSKTLKSMLNNHSNTTSVNKSSQGWMKYLGLGSKGPSLSSPSSSSPGNGAVEKQSDSSSISEDAKKLAAAALSAVKDSAAASLAASNRGKVEITEVRDFAGEEIEVKKLVDEVSDKGKGLSGPASAVDAVLEQIKKKPKLSVLDKTKKDWGEYKEENKGLEDELDAYKKSSNQYLDKVSFLERTDLREYEKERDARLAGHAKRKPDMREDL